MGNKISVDYWNKRRTKYPEKWEQLQYNSLSYYVEFYRHTRTYGKIYTKDELRSYKIDIIRKILNEYANYGFVNSSDISFMLFEVVDKILVRLEEYIDISTSRILCESANVKDIFSYAIYYYVKHYPWTRYDKYDYNEISDEIQKAKNIVHSRQIEREEKLQERLLDKPPEYTPSAPPEYDQIDK